MKKILLAFTAVMSLASVSFGQACLPNPVYTALGVGVYPLPDTFTTSTSNVLSMNAGAGFNGKPAAVGCPYEYTFTAVVPTSIPVGALTVNLNYVDVKQIKFYDVFAQGTTPVTSTLKDLGLDSIAVPSNFRFVGGTTGCLKLSGTIGSNIPAGTYDAEITVDINTSIGPLNGLHFPARPGEITNQLTTGRGRYRIVIHPVGSDCATHGGDLVAGVENTGDVSLLKAVPNPFSTSTNIEFNSLSNGTVEFQVTDLMGRVVAASQERVLSGNNYINFDGSQLANGVYIYSIEKDGHRVSSKMVIAH
jgi:Secretion system C-terminal sorting domain